MVGDHEAAVASSVDPVDRPPQSDVAAIGEFDRCRVVGAESHLGGEHRGSAGDHEFAVVAEPRQQIVEHPCPFVGPERRTAGPPAALGAFAHLIEELGEATVVVGVPSVSSRLGERALDDRPMEQVERCVVSGAPVACGDADRIARFLDRFDVEEVVVEVGVRTSGPRFESAGRDDVVEPGYLDRGQIAVVRGERIAVTRFDELDATLRDLVDAIVGETVVGADVMQASAEAVFEGACRKRHRSDAGVVRRHGSVFVDPRGDPPGQLDR